MKLLMRSVACVLAATLAACGGGGGSSGGSGSTGGGTAPVAAGTITLEVLGGGGSPTVKISTAEVAQLKATVKNQSGAAIKNTIVNFAETGGSLLVFSPTSGTAATDENGVAMLEVKAAGGTSLGATTVGASAQVNGQPVTISQVVTLTSAPSTGQVDPQTLASALNFLDANPADRSIVIAGAGGSGRSESATLRFRVVDRNNASVKGAAVVFNVVPANAVTLNIPRAVSDSEGVVTTTVSSRNIATAVVINAQVEGKNISSQSDQLTITTGIATQRGFDLSASKFHLNSAISGDSSELTVRIIDSNGNPVADGVPVVFTADYGRVGSSTRGGCTTVNGACTVTYEVQDPRPADGTLATVTVSTQVGNGTAISGVLRLAIVNPGDLNIYTSSEGGSLFGDFDLNTCGKQSFQVFVGTPANFAAPAGTGVAVTTGISDLTATVLAGGTILDQRAFGRRTALSVEFDRTAVAGSGSTTVEIKLTSGAVVQTISRRLNFAACTGAAP